MDKTMSNNQELEELIKKNIYSEGELQEAATVRNFRTVRIEGDREVVREIEHYNLDMIISLGYRIKSSIATKFRIWATGRLREYIIKGFAMDDERLKENGGGAYWKEFENFYRDMGEPPEKGLTIERIDNERGYSKENCRWATMAEQGQNRRGNRHYEYRGKKQTIAGWARELGLSHSAMEKRFTRWSVEKAITERKMQ